MNSTAYTANRRHTNTLSYWKSSFFGELLLFFGFTFIFLFIHIHSQTPAHLQNFTLWKDIYPKFFLLQLHLTFLYFPSGEQHTIPNCFFRGAGFGTIYRHTIHSFWYESSTEAGDPFYGRAKLWLPLEDYAEIGAAGKCDPKGFSFTILQ